MPLRMGVCLVFFLLFPGWVLSAEHESAQEALDVPAWMILPFVGMLLSIAVLPIFAAHFWHSNLNKALVAFVFAAPVVGYLWYLDSQGQAGFKVLLHGLQEYSSFIVLLFSLYTIAGGIVVQGNFRATPLVNVSFLAIGAALANLIGTTGASMVLIRPVLRINRHRSRASHIPIFFIFAVSNLGGLLTPLGDPPLFLGFLHGVSFDWTFSLWPQFLIAVGGVLLIFVIWDTVIWSGERTEQTPPAEHVPFQIRGLINFVLLAGVLAAVLFQSESVSKPVTEFLNRFVPALDVQLRYPMAEIIMAALAILSILFTSRELRQANAFTWEAIIEVAVLFAGIFVAMVPALVLLGANAEHIPLTSAWHYFWLTGALSSFLDNAPTYLTFATIAAAGDNFAPLMVNEPRVLQAISCGAVFFGAMTYIGNGPNFMVKAIAEASGYRTPAFFGYLVYSCAILLPIFVVLTFLFFWP